MKPTQRILWPEFWENTRRVLAQLAPEALYGVEFILRDRLALTLSTGFSFVLDYVPSMETPAFLRALQVRGVADPGRVLDLLLRADLYADGLPRFFIVRVQDEESPAGALNGYSPRLRLPQQLTAAEKSAALRPIDLPPEWERLGPLQRQTMLHVLQQENGR